MDRLSRIPGKGINSTLIGLQQALKKFQPTLWTALPAMVNSFNAAKSTVQAQPTIQAQVFQPNGQWIDTNLPLCNDCPIVFPGGGGFSFTFPLAKGDEGLLVFASRCIDSWWQSGGIQKQAELRMHDLSDGFFLPTGGMSNAKVPSSISTTGAELRSANGMTSVHMDATTLALAIGGLSFTLDTGSTKCSIVAPGGLWINGVQVIVP
jgi:hypothetical protein